MKFKNIFLNSVLGIIISFGLIQIANAENNKTPEITTPKTFTQSKDNKINGKVPPGKVGVTSRTILVDQIINGMDYSVMKVVRAPGFRTPVHYHLISPTTCVLEGQTTFYLEGHKPRKYNPGECFIMPAYTKGTNLSSGDKPLVLLDFMVLPKGVPSWIIFEDAPGYEDPHM